MAITKFEEIISWQKAQNLAVDIYSFFAHVKDYGFKDQICRAAVSISNNIAEGYDRSSNKEFTKFLYYAVASCSEVKSMLYLASRLNYINDDQRILGHHQCDEISRYIHALRKSLKT